MWGQESKKKKQCFLLQYPFIWAGQESKVEKGCFPVSINLINIIPFWSASSLVLLIPDAVLYHQEQPSQACQDARVSAVSRCSQVDHQTPLSNPLTTLPLHPDEMWASCGFVLSQPWSQPRHAFPAMLSHIPLSPNKSFSCQIFGYINENLTQLCCI